MRCALRGSGASCLVYGCMLCLVRYLFVISTSVIDCLGKFVPEMTYYVSSGTLNLTKLKLKLNVSRQWRAVWCSPNLPCFVNEGDYGDDDDDGLCGSFTRVSAESVGSTVSPTSLRRSSSVCVSTSRLKASSHLKQRATLAPPRYATALSMHPRHRHFWIHSYNSILMWKSFFLF